MGRPLKMSEVSQRLDKPIETLRRWRKTSYGPPSFLLGGDVRYDEDDLEAWLAAQRQAGLTGDLRFVANPICHNCSCPVTSGQPAGVPTGAARGEAATA